MRDRFDISGTSPNKRVEVYLLSAGKSERLGVSKQLLRIGGETILSHMARTFFRAGLKRVRVIGRVDDELLAREAYELGLRYIINLDSELGMVRSILEALDDCRSEWMALCPADLPLLEVETIERCVSMLDRGYSVIQPICGGVRKHPVFLKDHLRLSLRMAIQEGKTLRDFLITQSICTVDVEDCSQFQDVDTLDDYRKILKEFEKGMRDLKPPHDM